MNTGLKNKILRLRNEGKTYNEIKKELNCSKATISYHCQRHGVSNYDGTKLSKTARIEMNEYYKTHSIKETALKFNVSDATVIRYTDNKHIKLSDQQIKINNYKHLKSFRQRLKEKAVNYKGGCCEKCGYKKCNGALEFHHLDPKEKYFGISGYKTLSWDKIKIELDKCILVCANCHREIEEEIYQNCAVYPHADTV